MTARSTESFPKTPIPIPPPARDRLRGLADAYAVIVVSAVALVWLALEGGGYGEVARPAAGLVIWLFVFGLLLVRGGVALPRGPVLVVAVAVGALALVTGLSMLWSESAGRSWDELTRVLAYLGLFLTVAAVGSDARRRGQALEGLTLGMVLVVVVALLSRLEPGLFHEQNLQRFAPEFRPRLAYPFGYWNALGSFAAMTLVLLVHAASRADRPPRYRAAATAVLPAVGLALYLTFSRGSLVAAALGSVLILSLSPRRLAAFGAMAIGLAGTATLALLVRSWAELNDGLIESSAARSQGHRALAAVLVVAAASFGARLLAERSPLPRRAADAWRPHRTKIAIAATVFAAAVLAGSAPSIADRVGEFNDPVVFQGGAATQNVQTRLTSASANGRYQFWSSSWDAWQSRPVAGRGAGTWEFWWRRHATINAPTRDSHSLFFDVMAELGTLGMVALLALFGSSLWLMLAAVRGATGAARASLAAIAAVAVTWTFGAAIDWVWEFAALGFVFFALAALAASARRDQLGAAGKGAAPARTRLITALALGAWIVVVVQGISLTSSWSVVRSQDAVARGDLPAAESAAKRARAVEPWSCEPYMQLALVRVRSAFHSSAPRAAYDRAIADAREAVECERTNWRTWLVLTRVEARAGRLGDAARHNAEVARLARGSAIVPTYQELLDLSTSKDRSLSPGF